MLVLGIWAGIIPFVGPYFHYSFGSNDTWHYTANRFWLDILPAAAVVLGSLVLLRSANRVSGVMGSWLAIIGGAWLAVGPAVSRVWEHGAGPIGQPLYGSSRQMLELVGYFYGVGVLIATLSAFALGRFVSRPALAVAESDDTDSRQVVFEPVSAPAVVTGRRQPSTDRREIVSSPTGS